jgi:DNA adenine methylase
MKPFIKWAGGKSRISSLIIRKLPEKINKYVEPFLGGGSILIELIKKSSFNSAVCMDINEELIHSYNQIKTNVENLIKELSLPSYSYSRENFERIKRIDKRSLSDIEIASRFIFLNKTCFSGLYRVNKKGEFNTPFGVYDNPKIFSPDNFRELSVGFSKVDFICGDFRSFNYEELDRNDAVYFDPPYIPISKTSSFTGYSKGGFSIDDHRYLAFIARNCSCPVFISNSDCEKSREIFQDFNLDSIEASRSTGSNHSSRTRRKELIIG